MVCGLGSYGVVVVLGLVVRGFGWMFCWGDEVVERERKIEQCSILCLF